MFAFEHLTNHLLRLAEKNMPLVVTRQILYDTLRGIVECMIGISCGSVCSYHIHGTSGGGLLGGYKARKHSDRLKSGIERACQASLARRS